MTPTRIARRLRDHDWFGVAIELAVVVLGILIAFQVDRQRERKRGDRLQTGSVE